jgi:hypothetical protein
MKSAEDENTQNASAAQGGKGPEGAASGPRAPAPSAARRQTARLSGAEPAREREAERARKFQELANEILGALAAIGGREGGGPQPDLGPPSRPRSIRESAEKMMEGLRGRRRGLRRRGGAAAPGGGKAPPGRQ